MKTQNPANSEKNERTRIPMSIPQQKLAVPDIPGYHLHWFNGNASRIQQALRAGYEFVDPSEVDVTNTGLADDVSKSGNSDMGSRVSIISGNDTDVDGSVPRLYLMKIRQEFWEEDQKTLEDRNEQIAATLRGGGDVAGNPNGGENRYIPEAHRKGVANMFTPKRRSA